MFTKTFLTTRLTFAHTMAALALGVSLFVFQASFTHAATASMSNGSTAISKTVTATELQAQIAQLQNQLRELNTSVPSTSSQFAPGMSVEITDTLRVRNSASIVGRIMGTQRSGAKGVVVEGPIRQGGHMWVKVDYENGPDGWNAAGWLKNRTSPDKSVDATFTATASELKATVSFTLSNGCGGYVISWGDGTKTELAGATTGRPCTMAIVNVSKEHTYAKAGTYTVKVERFNGSTRRDVSEKEIKVGTTAGRDYGLENVSKITKQFIDPNPAIADEEFTQYVITLKTGRKIEVKVYGRTVPGTTEEAFRKTGFIGDVNTLMSRARELPASVETPKPVATTTPAIINCKIGLESYKEGTKRTSILNANGSRSVISDGSYVCRSGKWVIEGSLPKPDVPASTSVSSTTIQHCMNGLLKLAEGTKVQTITENGQTRTIADASFVCKGGKWVIEGSMPKPVNPECVKATPGYQGGSRPSTAECLGTSPAETPVALKSCTLKTTTYKHGESAKFAQTTGGSSRPSNGALVTHMCQNGEWKQVTSTSTSTGGGSSSGSTTQSGAVRGASTDIMTEIGRTLQNIKNILAGII